ncbi:MAG: alkyl hydroperoxide reductase subunit F, partial [Rhodospirillaceae bacterium]|nr:alkyl hydroperoxide reductase subunit F [Rhodospirillaceae bacterium]
MLDDTLKSQLKGYLENLRQPIELVASLDGEKASREMESLLADIAQLSDKVSWRKADGDETDARVPSFTILRDGEETGARFAG